MKRMTMGLALAAMLGTGCTATELTEFQDMTGVNAELWFDLDLDQNGNVGTWGAVPVSSTTTTTTTIPPTTTLPPVTCVETHYVSVGSYASTLMQSSDSLSDVDSVCDIDAWPDASHCPNGHLTHSEPTFDAVTGEPLGWAITNAITCF